MSAFWLKLRKSVCFILFDLPWKVCFYNDFTCFYTLLHAFTRFHTLPYASIMLSYTFIRFHTCLYAFICFCTLLLCFLYALECCSSKSVTTRTRSSLLPCIPALPAEAGKNIYIYSVFMSIIQPHHSFWPHDLSNGGPCHRRFHDTGCLFAPSIKPAELLSH